MVSLTLDKSGKEEADGDDDDEDDSSSFEDLSADFLYSKFRFVIVDCRLNILQKEVALPHCISFEVLAASQAEQLIT